MVIVLNKIESWLSLISKIAVVGLMLLMTLDTVLRYFFNSPISGATAISAEVFMIAIVFLSLPFSFSSDAQIRITFIRDRLGPKSTALMESFFCLIAGVFWALLCYQYFLRFVADIQAGIPPSVSFVVPRIIPDSIILVGTFVLTIRLAFTCVKQFLLWLRDFTGRNNPDELDGKGLKN